ncbi:MAG: hypothetical protein ACRDG8_01910 [Actinomycetota bacterium]
MAKKSKDPANGQVSKGENPELERFESLARRLISVPKKEIDQKRDEAKKPA